MHLENANWTYSFKEPFKRHDLYLIDYMQKQGAEDFFSCMFYTSCKQGILKEEELKESIHPGYLKKGFYFACKHDQKTTIELFIKHNYAYYTRGFEGACKGGHLDIVKQMLAKILKNEYDYYEEHKEELEDDVYLDQEYDIRRVVDIGISNAAEKGHLHVVKYLRTIFSNKFQRYQFHSVFKGGNQQLIKMAEKDIKYDFDEYGPTEYNRGLMGACHGGHITLVDYCINKKADDFVNSTTMSIIGGHTKLVKYMLPKCEKRDLNMLLRNACGSKHENRLEIIKILIDYGADKSIINDTPIKFLVPKDYYQFRSFYYVLSKFLNDDIINEVLELLFPLFELHSWLDYQEKRLLRSKGLN